MAYLLAKVQKIFKINFDIFKSLNIMFKLSTRTEHLHVLSQQGIGIGIHLEVIVRYFHMWSFTDLTESYQGPQLR